MHGEVLYPDPTLTPNPYPTQGNMDRVNMYSSFYVAIRKTHAE